MKTREEMITRLVDHRIDCWYEWKPYEIDDLFRGGMKGYDEMSDEELKDEYELYFEYEEEPSDDKRFDNADGVVYE